jgi:HPr kinase/phosphorylase
LGLIEMGHSLVSDDVTILSKSSWGGLMGSAVELTRFHMEIRGIGIIHVPSLYGVTSVRGEKQLDVIIELYQPDEETKGIDLDEVHEVQKILGVEVPMLRIPVRSGRDIAHLVQVAALNQKLRLLGHDATKELDERVVRELTKKRGSSD